MPIAIHQPQEKDSDLDQIAKAVNIAATIYGIKLKKDESDLTKKAMEQKTAEENRVKSGVKNENEYQQMLSGGALEIKEGAPKLGEQNIPVLGADGKITQRRTQPAPFVKQEMLAKKEDVELNRKMAEAKKAEAKAASQQDFQRTGSLSNDYNKLSKDTMQAYSGFKKVEAAASNPNPTGATDMSLIFGFMKTIDPGSTVREGEFANAENSQGISEQVRNLYNKALSGERLTPEARQNFIVEAQRAIKTQLDTQRATDERFLQASQKFGVDPKFVINPQFEQLRQSLDQDPRVVKKIGIGISDPAIAAPAENEKTVNGVRYRKVPKGWEAIE